MHRGKTGQITVKIEAVSNFNGRVDLLSSLLYGTTITFSPHAIENGGGTAALTIAPSDSAIKGTYTLSISGTSDGTARSTTVMVTIK